MSDSSLRSSSLTEQFSQVIARQIESGERGLGSRLPTEEQLAIEFGVSRTVVREGIARLKGDGLVTTRQGLGAFVVETFSQVPFRLSREASPTQKTVQEVFELRLGFEAEAATLAASRATSKQLTTIRQALHALDAVQDKGGNGVEEDMRFHLAIARATNNSVYAEFGSFLERYVREQLAISRGNSSSAGWLALVQREHNAIYAAIAARDPEAAGNAARQHLRNGMDRLKRFHSH
jgi:GntR family transcriptional repressor for pyruvate dehydrogenase complex